MKPEKLTVRQLISGIPSTYLDAIADETQSDLHQKKLPSKDIFYLLLYGLFDSTSLSWRVLEEHYKSPIFQKGFQPSALCIDHSSIGERLEKIPLTYFENLFDYSFSLFCQHYQPQDYKRFNLIRFDSTTVTLSSKLLNVGLQGGGYPNKNATPKRAIKYSVGFNGTFAVKAKAFFKNIYYSENIALSEIIHQTEFKHNDVAVFDRGLTGKKHLAAISLADIGFVTRINAQNILERCTTLPFSTRIGCQDSTVVVLEDTLVYCFTERYQKVEVPFRLVVCKQKTTGETLYFLTNMIDVKALEIAQIYRLRWEIELFFKFIKQNLSFSHLLSRKEHTIQIMLYMTLIAASMIYLYRKLNDIDSFKIAKMRFMSQLQIELIRIILENDYSKKLFAIENLDGP